MSTIIVAAVLILVVISICLILISLNNKDRRKKTTGLLNHFSKSGIENNLTFSSEEILQNCIIGLDGMKRKLLILETNDEDEYNSFVLDLNDIKSCSKKKIYRSVNVGTEKKEKFENQVKKIVLAFDFNDTRQPVHISFFDPVTNHVFRMLELEQKANNWETILTKLLSTDLKRIA
jgi:hypothetical protein